MGRTAIAAVVAESNLSLLLRDVGELDEAEKHARIAVEHADKAFGADNAYRGIMHDGLGDDPDAREERYAEAEHELDTAWNILVNAKDFGPQHPRSQEVVDHYIELYDAWDKPEREAAWRARKTTSASLRPHPFAMQASAASNATRALTLPSPAAFSRRARDRAGCRRQGAPRVPIRRGRAPCSRGHRLIARLSSCRGLLLDRAIDALARCRRRALRARLRRLRRR